MDRPTYDELRRGAGGKVPAEVLEWARQNLDQAQMLAELQDFERTGGEELSQFLNELEAAARRHD